MRGKMSLRKILMILGLASGVMTLVLAFATYISLKPVAQSLHKITANAHMVRITDKDGAPLNITYQNRWNSFDHVPLYDMPELLKTAFIISEDRRFFEHHGVDWRARASALMQNVRSLHNVRGASTITEQAVRLINTRPRTLWSRWLEGFEAQNLEQTTSKSDILEFYLNQVPYASNRRGIAQAARYYFNRDLSTLSHKEMLVLAVLVRAPSGYDLYKNPQRIEKHVMRLAKSLKETGTISETEFASMHNENITTSPPSLPIDARHFARYVRLSAPQTQNSIYRTSLDSTLQNQVQNVINTRLSSLKDKNVHNAAALVADYTTGEILAWVVGGVADETLQSPALEIDTVTTPRQPGSAMKPFLYALALDKGWTAATFIDDSPLADAVGTGLHNFRNYSNIYYGKITLREALGNSLNIPALLAIRYTGTGNYLTLLQNLGFKSLSLNSQVYDEGLALGNGEVTLLEMVQAYASLANNGVYKPFHLLKQQDSISAATPIYTDESASLIGNILSDPWARRMEFGASSVLNLPQQTAVKTGTSTDYRDAWVFGYNDRYVVGIWMGNLDHAPMDKVTGSTGPALALRSIFALLNKNRDADKLYFSPKLSTKDVCIRPPETDGSCIKRTEWFAPDTMPDEAANISAPEKIEMVRPTQGLQIAYDPRVAPDHQKFRFEIKGARNIEKVTWILNGAEIAQGEQPFFLWPVQRGKYTLSAELTDNKNNTRILPPAQFLVK